MRQLNNYVRSKKSCTNKFICNFHTIKSIILISLYLFSILSPLHSSQLKLLDHESINPKLNKIPKLSREFSPNSNNDFKGFSFKTSAQEFKKSRKTSTNELSSLNSMNTLDKLLPYRNEPDTHRCEPINLVLCKGMYYEYTRMPNMFHHETQEEAGLEAHQFYPLVQINCSKDLRFLLCSIYTPICVKGYPHFLPPCRSVCQRVKAGCAPVMEHYDFPWPERMNCEQFPELNNSDGILCMERNLTQTNEEKQLLINKFKKNDKESKNNIKKLNNIINNDNLKVKSSKKTDKNVEIFTNEKENKPNEQNVNEVATKILFTIAMKNEKMKKLKNLYPNLKLKCNCGCHSPLVKTTSLNMKNPDKLNVVGIEDCTIPCHAPYFHNDKSDRFTTFWFAIWSICCIISTLLTIITFITDSYRFQYPELSIIYLSGCYLFLSIGYLLRVFIGHESIACDSLNKPVENSYLQSVIYDSNVNNYLSSTMESVKNVGMIMNNVYDSTISSTLSNSQQDEEVVVVDSIQQNEYVRMKTLHNAFSGRTSCAIVFLLIYYFTMASCVWWVLLTLTWLLAAGLKWGSEAISKYSQVYHFIAWSLPAAQTALALFISVVEGDNISGLCNIGTSKPLNLILFAFLPMLVYVVVGGFFLTIGFIALFRIRGVIKLQRSNLVKTQKLDKLMIRIGIFGMFYLIPNVVILICLGYEFHETEFWHFGLACKCDFYVPGNNDQYMNKYFNTSRELPKWTAPKPEYAVFMLKYFMSLAVGITSGFWIWSYKTLQSWKRLCYGNCLVKTNKKHNSSTGLLTTPIGIEPDICNKMSTRLANSNLQKCHLPQKDSHKTQSNKKIWTDQFLYNTHSYDMVDYPIKSVNNNAINTVNHTPSTPYSTSHLYESANHQSNESSTFPTPTLNMKRSLTNNTTNYCPQFPQQISTYHPITNTNYNLRNNSSQTNQLFNPDLINNNNHLININQQNSMEIPMNSSISTGFSSSGISSIPNDQLTRTGSYLNGSEQNFSHLSSSVNVDLNGNQNKWNKSGHINVDNNTNSSTTTTTTNNNNTHNHCKLGHINNSYSNNNNNIIELNGIEPKELNRSDQSYQHLLIQH